MGKEQKTIPCPHKCTLSRNVWPWRENDGSSLDSVVYQVSWTLIQMSDKFQVIISRPSRWPNMLAFTHSALQSPWLRMSSDMGLPDSTLVSWNKDSSMASWWKGEEALSSTFEKLMRVQKLTDLWLTHLELTPLPVLHQQSFSCEMTLDFHLDDCYQLGCNGISNTLSKNKERIFKFTFTSEHIGESKCSHDSLSPTMLMSPFCPRWHHPVPSSLWTSRFYPLVENYLVAYLIHESFSGHSTTINFIYPSKNLSRQTQLSTSLQNTYCPFSVPFSPFFFLFMLHKPECDMIKWK